MIYSGFHGMESAIVFTGVLDLHVKIIVTAWHIVNAITIITTMDFSLSVNFLTSVYSKGSAYV